MLQERVSVADGRPFEPVEVWPGPGDMSRLQKLLWAAKRPIVLLGGSRWSRGGDRIGHAVCRTLRAAGRDHVSPRTSLRSAAPKLCGRPRPWPQSEASGAHPRGRLGRARRRKARRDPLAGLYAVRYSGARARPSCMCIRARRSSAASISRTSPSRQPRPALPRRSKACSRRTRFRWRADTSGAHDDYLAWTDEATAAAGRREFRRGDRVAARASAARCVHLQRRRKFLGLDSPLLSVPPLPHAYRRRPPAPWATACLRLSA